MLAELKFKDCRVPRENLIGKPGFGFSHIASSALDCGRYSVAWGCLGLAQACLEASIRYATQRKQFGAFLIDHQLIQQMISDMITNVKAARLLCLHAGHLREYQRSGGHHGNLNRQILRLDHGFESGERRGARYMGLTVAVANIRFRDTFETPRLWRSSRAALRCIRSILRDTVIRNTSRHNVNR